MYTQLEHLQQIANAAFEYRDAQQVFDMFQTQTFRDRMEAKKSTLDNLLALHMPDYIPIKFKKLSEIRRQG